MKGRLEIMVLEIKVGEFHFKTIGKESFIGSFVLLKNRIQFHNPKNSKVYHSYQDRITLIGTKELDCNIKLGLTAVLHKLSNEL